MSKRYFTGKFASMFLVLLPVLSTAAEPKLYGGGGIGLSFGAVTSVKVNPFVGYRILPKTSIGAGAIYEYYASEGISTSIYGGSIFSEQYLNDKLYLHGEYELLSLETAVFDQLEMHTGKNRFLHHGVLVGGGYRQKLSDRGAFFILVLANLNQSANSPYMMPLVKIGFSFG